MTHDATMMLLETKIRPQACAAATVYLPTAALQQANYALAVLCYTQATVMCRHAHMESMWGPLKDGFLELRH